MAGPAVVIHGKKLTPSLSHLIFNLFIKYGGMGFSPLEALLNFSWCELICRKNLSDNLSSELLHQSLASGLYGPSKIELVTGSSNSGGGGVGIQPFEDSDSSFQYVLTAPTSIATKVKIFGIMEGKRSCVIYLH